MRRSRRPICASARESAGNCQKHKLRPPFVDCICSVHCSFILVSSGHILGHANEDNAVNHNADDRGIATTEETACYEIGNH